MTGMRAMLSVSEQVRYMCFLICVWPECVLFCLCLCRWNTCAPSFVSNRNARSMACVCAGEIHVLHVMCTCEVCVFHVFAGAYITNYARTTQCQSNRVPTKLRPAHFIRSNASLSSLHQAPWGVPIDGLHFNLPTPSFTLLPLTATFTPLLSLPALTSG